MTKVLIINEYIQSCPYITELVKYINENIEFSVDILDIRKVRIIYSNKKNIDLIKSRIVIGLTRLPKIGKYFKIIYIKKFLHKEIDQYQVINIHFALLFYNNFISIFKNYSGKKIVSMWGSDFLRSGKHRRAKQLKLYSIMDVITFNNMEIEKQFLDYYNQFDLRTKIIKFGFQSLDIIESLNKDDKTVLRKQLNLNTSKIIVTIGYNGRKEQQHTMILEALRHCTRSVLDKIFLLLPMTYLGKKEYLKEIGKQLDELKVDYKIIDRYISIGDICKIRVISDIVINAQTSDSFSASLQEHLSANNIVVVGSWLPYKILDDHGVYFFKFDSVSTLTETFLYAVENLFELKRKCRKNSGIIYDISGWSSNIKDWHKLYSERV